MNPPSVICSIVYLLFDNGLVVEAVLPGYIQSIWHSRPCTAIPPPGWTWSELWFSTVIWFLPKPQVPVCCHWIQTVSRPSNYLRCTTGLCPWTSPNFILSTTSQKCLQGVTTILFADDTTILIAGQPTANISVSLTFALDCAHKWLSDSCFELNLFKSKFTLIWSSRWKSIPSLNIHRCDMSKPEVVGHISCPVPTCLVTHFSWYRSRA